jgi:sigma-E factor negative regulatory protein RseB
MIQSEGREVSRTLEPQSSSKPDGSMEGWTLGWRPEGFQPAATPRSGSGKAVAFSDGLASFSVFVESVAGTGMPSGTSRIGATTVYMRQLAKGQADFLVTVVGEIPLKTALKVAESVEIEDFEVLGANQP